MEIVGQAGVVQMVHAEQLREQAHQHIYVRTIQLTSNCKILYHEKPKKTF